MTWIANPYKPAVAERLNDDCDLTENLAFFLPITGGGLFLRDLSRNRNAVKLESGTVWSQTPYGWGIDFRGLYKGALRDVIPISSTTEWSCSFGWTATDVVQITTILGSSADGYNHIGLRNTGGGGPEYFFCIDSAYTGVQPTLNSPRLIGHHHYTVTQSGSTWTGYRDGALTEQKTNATGLLWSTVNLLGDTFWGNLNVGEPLLWVAVHNRALSHPDVAKLHDDPWAMVYQHKPWRIGTAGSATVGSLFWWKSYGGCGNAV